MGEPDHIPAAVASSPHPQVSCIELLTQFVKLLKEPVVKSAVKWDTAVLQVAAAVVAGLADVGKPSLSPREADLAAMAVLLPLLRSGSERTAMVVPRLVAAAGRLKMTNL